VSALRRMLGGRRPFVVAEIGVNHDGHAGTALALVELAARAGAHAVKFQAFKAERLVRADAPLARYQERNLGGDPGGQLAMLRRLEIASSTLADCRGRARTLGLAFGVTPFDERSLAEVLLLEPDFLKIGSGDADNLPLLEAARDSGRPVLVSTGMCALEEAARVVRWFRPHRESLALLHCVSAYPAPEAECNLAVLAHLRELGCVTGFSDHTTGHRAAAWPRPWGRRSWSATSPWTAPRPVRTTPAPATRRGSGSGWRRSSGPWRCWGMAASAACPARRTCAGWRASPWSWRGTSVRANGWSGWTWTACGPADGLPPWRLKEMLGRRARRDLRAGGPLDPQDWRAGP
jgi:N,N'-diacetyllegionaminate synthase